MNKLLTSVLFLCLGFLTFSSARCETVWADDSINEVIIKQYDANALRDEFLPALPDSLKNKPVSTIETKNTESKVEKTSSKPLQAGTQKSYKASSAKDYVTIKKGTKFRLRLEQTIDDMAIIGSNVYFTSLYPETNKYVTIPAGTKFIGKVEDAHLPQISANGGLLVIAVDRFVYEGRTYPIESKIIMVGEKRIFQNNIKGKRTYWKNLANSTKPGRKFYSKSWKLTKKFAGDGLEIILTPITFVGGATVLAANVVASPAIALFSKGGRLKIDKGTRFQIKLTEDAFVNL